VDERGIRPLPPRGDVTHPEHWTEARVVNEAEMERRFEFVTAGWEIERREFIEGAGWARPQMTEAGRKDFNEHYARTEGSR
jgi:hypothetical protein